MTTRRRVVADPDPSLDALLAICTPNTDPSDILDVLTGTDPQETT